MSGDQGIRCFDMQNPISDWMRPLAGSGPGLPECRICVSRTEWNRGVFDSQKGDLHIVPEGSVARKMALVAAGDFDLTVSLYPKNDWDIAGGMALILAAGGTILSTFLTLDASIGVMFTMKALIIVIMGGVGDVRGAVVAAVILGLAETFVASVIDPGLTLAAAYLLFVLVLLFRPQGLFGRRAS